MNTIVNHDHFVQQAIREARLIERQTSAGADVSGTTPITTLQNITRTLRNVNTSEAQAAFEKADGVLQARRQKTTRITLLSA